MSARDARAQELERQYNNQRRVPEYPDIAADWARRTAELQARVGPLLDLAYGDGPRERLDLYRSAGGDGATLVYIHGGYWQRGDKSAYGFIAEGPLALGMHVAIINYGLCPSQPFAAITPQVRAALTWLLTRGGDLDIDPGRVIVSGHSAGGHLTAALLVTDFSTMDPGLPPCPFAGALAISGVFELAPLIPTSINDALGLDAALARGESPGLRLPVPGACPLVAAVGGDESEEFRRQSRDLARAWGEALTARCLELPGCNHFTVLESLADHRGALCAAVAGLRPGGGGRRA